MERKLMERNLSLYPLHVIFGEPIFWGPVLVSSLMLLGKMSLQDIYVMEAIVMVGYSIVEVHTGAVADVLGRKFTIILGKILETLGMIWFARMNSVVDAWGANCVFMLGISFCSGSDRTLIVATLKQLGYEGDGAKAEFAKITGITLGNKFIILACASLVTGFLAEIDVRLPLYLCIPVMLFSIGISCFFTEVQNGKTVKGSRSTAVKENVFQGLRLFFSTKTMVWIGLSMALLQISSKIWFFTYNPYLELIEIQYRYYGYIFFALNIVGWYFSRNASRIMKKYSARKIITGMVVSVGASMVLMGIFVCPLSASLVVLQNFTRGMFRPFFDSELHHVIYSEDLRATLDSVASALNRFLEAILLLVFRALLDSTSLSTSLVIVGFTVLLCGSVSIGTHKKVFG